MEFGESFKKKPVTIKAIQWKGDNLRDVVSFMQGKPVEDTSFNSYKWEQYEDYVARFGLQIPTLEGVMKAKLSDMIIRGVQGELYPCDIGIFNKTYSKDS